MLVAVAYSNRCTRDNASLIAACDPDTIRELLAERERYCKMWMNDSDFWKMCALLGIVCASIGAFTYVMAGVVAEVIRPAIAAMVAS